MVTSNVFSVVEGTEHDRSMGVVCEVDHHTHLHHLYLCVLDCATDDEPNDFEDDYCHGRLLAHNYHRVVEGCVHLFELCSYRRGEDYDRVGPKVDMFHLHRKHLDPHI